MTKLKYQIMMESLLLTIKDKVTTVNETTEYLNIIDDLECYWNSDNSLSENDYYDQAIEIINKGI